MGSCFSKRKRSDATVTHNASPRSSFSLSCKSDVATAPLPLRAHKPSDEIVVVVSKASSPLLANTQNSHSLKRYQSAKACAQKMENAKAHAEETGSMLRSASQGTSRADCDNLSNAQKIDNVCVGSHSHEDSVDKKPIDQDLGKKVLQCSYDLDVSVADANEQLTCTMDKEDATKRGIAPPSSDVAAEANGIIVEDKEVLVLINEEFVVEADDADIMVPSSLATLKRSCSYEETNRSSEIKRPPGRRSFQEASTFSPRTARLETIPEPPQFGTTKFLEGLDLVDVLPHRLSHSEAEEELKPALLDLSQQEGHDLTADFFTLKNRYLSSCALSSHNAPPSGVCPQADNKVCSYNVSPDAEDDISDNFGFMHSRASSMDSVEHMDMMSLYSSCRHPIPVVQEEDENDCDSDDSETFEFKHEVSIHADVLNQRRAQLRDRVTEGEGEMKGVSSCRLKGRKELGSSKEGSGFTRHKELSVVATGDALLYTGSNSEEFDLIPSKSYVRGSPKMASDSCSDMVATNQDSYYNWHKGHADDDDQEKQQHSSLSVDDIILLLEKDELDEDALLSFLNLAKSTTSSHGGNTPSCPASDVASEASFEFKIKSSGSTPHSTPSTPMLSAGSTPKRITQLSPLALTSEEIAEIWGVFEQRQALSPFQRCSFP